ncbi:MAG: hypothetical protein HY901_03800, partial [Deltaproteobacteria bacterium]|nr:hypothetical protein [Deltaproteobacteria bacterium]
DGETDEDLAGSLVRIPLDGATPTTLSIAGIPGKGFVVGFATAAAQSAYRVLMLAEPDYTPGRKIEVAAGALLPLAVTESHVFWLQDDEVLAKELQDGLPAGSAIVTPMSPAPSELAAIGGATLGQSFAVWTGGTTFKALVLNGRKKTGFARSLPSPSQHLALARLDGESVLAVYEGGDGLAAIHVTKQSLGTLHPWSPASLLGARSPSGAGMAVAFVAKEGATDRVYIGRALDQRLAAEDYTAVSAAGNVNAPALAALGDSTWLVAWLQQNGSTTIVNTVRISWDSHGWGIPSLSTGFMHPSDATAQVVGVAAASDGTRFMVLAHTHGQAGDELFAWMDCPAN